MTTLTHTTTLHIFPVYGRWKNTDEVLVITTVGDLPISDAYEYMVFNHGERIVDRDHMFDIIALVEFRNRYDDVIMYAEPYSEMWCDACDRPRYPIVTRFGHKCDACDAAMVVPF